jgi:hypothetical protein
MTTLYRPLDPDCREIRLVTLSPGDFVDDICCSLNYVMHFFLAKIHRQVEIGLR